MRPKCSVKCYAYVRDSVAASRDCWLAPREASIRRSFELSPITMALTPFNDPFRRDDWWMWPVRSRILDQYFGMGLFDDPFFRFPMRPGVVDAALDQSRTGFSEVVNDKDKFVVKMDVTHFKPEEIKVKTMDNYLIVEGNHEEKKDEHGYVKRSFSRRYMLPTGVDVAAMNSSLTDDGVLTIQAPKLAIQAPSMRPIPIQAQPPPSGQQSPDAEKGGQGK